MASLRKNDRCFESSSQVLKREIPLNPPLQRGICPGTTDLLEFRTKLVAITLRQETLLDRAGRKARPTRVDAYGIVDKGIGDLLS